MSLDCPSYSVRNIPITPGLVLSPMSGVTTRPFRRLIKELNPGSVGLLVSEFVSVEAITRRIKRTLDMMKYHESERPYCIQIFGYDPKRMADAARFVQDFGADIVDINCGCPAPKVVRKGGGCELMRQPDHLRNVIQQVRKAVTIPLTLKMRSGWDSSSLNAIEIAKIAIEGGVEGLAIHGRTRAQMYRGEADWNVASEIASFAKVPVCGSGDVIDRKSAEERLRLGVSGLYIGRAAISNPFVFTEIVTGKKIPLREDPLLAVSVLERYIDLVCEEFNSNQAIGKIKQLASQMLRGHQWRKDLLVVGSIKEQAEILQRVKNGWKIQEKPSYPEVLSQEL